MHDRSALGHADVDDATLTAMVADLLEGRGVPTYSSLTRTWEEFPYDLPAITTAGRYVVSGKCRGRRRIHVVRDVRQGRAVVVPPRSSSSSCRTR